MSKQYYYLHPNGTLVLGPYAAETMRGLRNLDSIKHDTMVCLEGTEEWHPFSEYTELQKVNTSATAKTQTGTRKLTSKEVEALFALGFAVILALLFLIATNRPDSSHSEPTSSFNDTFEQADQVGKNFRYNNHPKPSWDNLDAEAKRRYPGDADKQKAWRSGVSHGYDNY